MKSVQWIRNLTEEDGMKSIGIKWDVVSNVRLNDIDWDTSLKNMGRLEEPLNEDRVKDYATAMMNGASFPMIVLVKMKNNKYRILSGNHRGQGAHSLGEKDITAYVVKAGTGEQEMDIFARSANAWNGEPAKKDERLQQAITLAEIHGYSNKDAAKRLGLKENAVHEARRAKECKNTLVSLGVDKAEKLPQGSLLKLNQVIDNDNVFRRAGELVSEFSIPVEEVYDMVKQIKKARTEAQKIGVIGDWEEKCNQQKIKRVAGGIPLKTRTKFLRWLNSGVNLIKSNPTRKRLQLEADELDEIRDTCVWLFGKLHTILGAKK